MSLIMPRHARCIRAKMSWRDVLMFYATVVALLKSTMLPLCFSCRPSRYAHMAMPRACLYACQECFAVFARHGVLPERVLLFFAYSKSSMRRRHARRHRWRSSYAKMARCQSAAAAMLFRAVLMLYEAATPAPRIRCHHERYAAMRRVEEDCLFDSAPCYAALPRD